MIEPLEREQRLFERVAEKMLGMVKSGVWSSGDRLPPERDLAESFNVSRTVIREAVKALEARGVLEAMTGSGVYVCAIDSGMVSRSLQTYLQLSNNDSASFKLAEIRRVLEVEIAGLAAERATSEQRQELRRICQEMRGTPPAATQTLAELDLKLHRLLAGATQNELFGVLLAPLMEELSHLFIYTWEGYGPRPLETIFTQHEALVTAVENHDREAARAAMIAHLAYSLEVFKSRLPAEPPTGH